MSKMNKAYLINPHDAEVVGVEIPQDDHVKIQELIECRCFAVGGYLDNGDVVYIDDEGLFGATHFFRIKDINGGMPLAGKGIVVGTGKDGASANAKTSKGELLEMVRWVYAMDKRGEVLFDVKASAKGQAAETEVVVL